MDTSILLCRFCLHRAMLTQRELFTQSIANREKNQTERGIKQREVSNKERTIIGQMQYRQYRIGRILPLLSGAWRKKINNQGSCTSTFFLRPAYTIAWKSGCIYALALCWCELLCRCKLSVNRSLTVCKALCT